MKKSKSTKLAVTCLLSSSLFFAGQTTSFAETSVNPYSQEDEIQKASYYVDGVEYVIPESQYDNLVSNDEITELPYDPTDEGVSDESIKNSILNSKKNKLEINKNNMKKGIGTDAVACVPGEEYDAYKQSSGFKKGKSGTRVINTSKYKVTQKSSVGSSVTISGTFKGSSKVDWKIINGELGFEASASYAWTDSQSLQVTVDPGDWGWIDYGTISEKWYGQYYMLTSSCKRTNSENVTTDGPKYRAQLVKATKYPY